MDYGRLAGNRIDGIEKLAELPCDMGFVGVEGGDHPFLYAQAVAEDVDPEARDDSREDQCQSIGGLAAAEFLEDSTECRVFRNQHDGAYWPHGDGWEDNLEPEDWGRQARTGTQYGGEGGGDGTQYGGDDGEGTEYGDDPPPPPPWPGDVLEYGDGSVPPVLLAAEAAKAELRKELKDVPRDEKPDLGCWFQRANCQRLGFYRDIMLRASGNYTQAEMDAARWGWFWPVVNENGVGASEPPLPANTRLVGRPLVGSYNKGLLLPPPEDGWSEDLDPDAIPENPPWEGHWEGDKWIPPDMSVRQKDEFGRSVVKQAAFTGAEWVEFMLPKAEREEETSGSAVGDDDEESSSGSDSSSSSSEEPPKQLEGGYIAKTSVPHPGFRNPYRAAELWAWMPLRDGNTICHASIEDDQWVEDYDDVLDFTKDPPEETKIILRTHNYFSGGYDWRFFCGFTERHKYDWKRNENGERVSRTIEVRYKPIWWSVNKPPKSSPPTPWDEDEMLMQISKWVHDNMGIPYGTRVDLRITAYVEGMKLAKAVADRLRQKGWTRTPLNPNHTPPKDREYWHTQTRFVIDVRQHQPLK